MTTSTETIFESSRSNACDLTMVKNALAIVEDEEGVGHSSQLDSFVRFPISNMDSDSSSSSLPPLDQVSLSSDEDDDSSLASSSFADEPESAKKGRRSIFNQYWEKVGGASSIRRELKALFAEEIIKSENKPTDKTSPASDNSRRRNIFNKTCWSESLPALTSVSDTAERNLQKIRSSSTPKQSCLRQGRFSSDQLLRDESESSSSSSVQFNLQADVKVFTPPVEIWASVDWSAWFA